MEAVAVWDQVGPCRQQHAYVERISVGDGHLGKGMYAERAAISQRGCTVAGSCDRRWACCARVLAVLRGVVPGHAYGSFALDTPLPGYPSNSWLCPGATNKTPTWWGMRLQKPTLLCPT